MTIRQLLSNRGHESASVIHKLEVLSCIAGALRKSFNVLEVNAVGNTVTVTADGITYQLKLIRKKEKP